MIALSANNILLMNTFSGEYNEEDRVNDFVVGAREIDNMYWHLNLNGFYFVDTFDCCSVY